MSVFKSPSSGRRVGIYGMPGIGKSQVMYKYIEDHAEEYVAVFVVDASTYQTLVNGFSEVFQKLNLPDRYKATEEFQIKGVVDWLRRHSEWLLVFDNVQEIAFTKTEKKIQGIVPYEELWETYMPRPAETCGNIIITTRSESCAREFGSGLHNRALHIEELDVESGVELLFQAGIGRNDDLLSRRQELDDLPRRLVQQLWYIPLTIEFVGKAFPKESSWREILQLLEDPSKRKEFLKHRSVTGAYRYTTEKVSILMLYSFDQLSKNALEVWRILAFLDPGWHSSNLFKTFRQTNDLQLTNIALNKGLLHDCWREFESAGIIQHVKGNDGCWTHDLIHESSRECLNPEDQQKCLTVAINWISCAFPSYGEFSGEHAWQHNPEFQRHARKLIMFADELNVKNKELQRLCWHASEWARFKGNYKDAEDIGKRAVELYDVNMGNIDDLWSARNSYALALRRQSRFAESKAILQKNLEEQIGTLERSIEDPRTLLTMNEIGWQTYLEGSYEEAHAKLDEVRKLREKVLGVKKGPTQHTWQNMAACLTKLGRLEEAYEWYERAYQGHKAIFKTGHHHWLYHIHDNMAQNLEAQGKLKEAQQLYREVLEGRKNLLGPTNSDTLWTAIRLARVYAQQHRMTDARGLLSAYKEDFRFAFEDDDPAFEEIRRILAREDR